MAKYKFTVDLISGLRPKNNADFPLVKAHDVQVDEDGTRLDEVLENGGGGGNANFIFADSVEELPDPSTVPEDTVALVPSSGESGGASGGGGLPVVELSEAFTGNDENIALTEAESAMLTNAAANKSPIVLVYNTVMDGTTMANAAVCRMVMGMYFVYADALTNILLVNSEGSWFATIKEDQ